MSAHEEVLALLLEVIKNNTSSNDSTVPKDPEEIPVGVSNRHAHLSQSDVDKLFGTGYQLTKSKDLSQPGQYACKETLILCGPKGSIEKVRILGPVRRSTQVEVLASDSYKLGVHPEVRLSGDLEGTDGITLVGPRGASMMSKGLIIAKRHIHMHCKEAKAFGVSDGQVVAVEVCGNRGGVYNHVEIRATENSAIEFHVDMEEANAMGINGFSKVKIKK
ncbi:Propanediol utilization protein [Alkaliphilus metalliredigens QYMF]|uniref:Phosphate propanoyltransferase n=1 Tax=Alkaliphilus metalliredigens (strain QYMF) TaxID=293826 RepID=A6TUS2_ALKMQ|nr:phosphate propanoyltransferase [Alkaliphilus metalliredigens]ABR49940.1 Propanediol utilization protein [Alkaliphilus metalliredigens QYMF]